MLKRKKNKGITLIALVITIVVLLILAGVSIAMLTGENGILNQAAKAKEQSEKASIIENIKLEIGNKEMEKITENSEKIDGNEVYEIFSKYGTVSLDGTTLVTSDKKYEIPISSVYPGMIAKYEIKKSADTLLYEKKGYITKDVFVEHASYRLHYMTIQESGYYWLENNNLNYLRLAIYDGGILNGSPVYYKKSSDADFPFEENKIYVKKGQILAINIDSNTSADFILYCHIPSLNDDIDGNIQEKKNVCIYRTTNATDDRQIYYSDKAKNVLSVFIPQPYGYLQYNIGKSEHTIEGGGGYSVWRMCVLYAVNDKFEKMFDITRPGEWEMAVKIAGRSDFIGGFEHGDEYQTEVKIFLDDIEIDPTTISEMTEFESLKVVCVSNMFDPDDHITKVGIHSKAWEWKKGTKDVLLTQSIQWLFESYTQMTASYMAMFPVIRGNDQISERQITDTFYSDVDSTHVDCSVYGFNGNIVGDCNKVTIFSQKSGFLGEVENIKYPKLEGFEAHVLNGENKANKIYFTVTGSGSYKHTVKPNEIWKSQTAYRVTLNKGEN